MNFVDKDGTTKVYIPVNPWKFLASRSDAVIGSKGLPEIIKNTVNVRQTKDNLL